jgi:hypothetical protein
MIVISLSFLLSFSYSGGRTKSNLSRIDPKRIESNQAKEKPETTEA